MRDAPGAETPTEPRTPVDFLDASVLYPATLKAQG